MGSASCILSHGKSQRLVKLTSFVEVLCITHFVEMPRVEKIFPQRNSASYMQNTAWWHAWTHACQNEVVIERYCTLWLFLYFNKHTMDPFLFQ